MLRRERTEAVADLGEISLRLRVASAGARASKHKGFPAAILVLRGSPGLYNAVANLFARTRPASRLWMRIAGRREASLSCPLC
jgi:hypothetical protein